jgi:hypothetical protein
MMDWVDVGVTKEDFEDTSDGGAIGTRVFYCEADEYVASDLVLAASFNGVAIPEKFAAFSEGRPRCRCSRRKVDRISANQFTVTVTYEDPTDGSTPENLLAKPAEIEESTESVFEPYQIDVEDKRVVNTAGVLFDPLPERQVPMRVFTIVKYVNPVTAAAIRNAWNMINSSAKTINSVSCEAKTAWLFDYRLPLVDTDVYRASIAIRYKPTGWTDKIENKGFQELVSGKLRNITVKDDRNVQFVPSEPMYLDVNGVSVNPAPASPLILEFHPYLASAWSGVPLT